LKNEFANIEKRRIEIKVTLFLEKNIPDVALTSLNLLSPEKLFATADPFSSDLAIKIKRSHSKSAKKPW
jgi:hypothetical protein